MGHRPAVLLSFLVLLSLTCHAQKDAYSWDYSLPRDWTLRVDKSVLHLYSADREAMALIARVPEEGSLQDAATRFAQGWMGKDRSEKILATDSVTLQGDAAVRVTFTTKQEKAVKKVWAIVIQSKYPGVRLLAFAGAPEENFSKYESDLQYIAESLRIFREVAGADTQTQVVHRYESREIGLRFVIAAG
jgi:hypothetical protein